MKTGVVLLQKTKVQNILMSDENEMLRIFFILIELNYKYLYKKIIFSFKIKLNELSKFIFLDLIFSWQLKLFYTFHAFHVKVKQLN